MSAPNQPKLKKLVPVLIIWEDARINIDFDGPPEDAPSTVIQHACGFLIRKTKKEVIIAMDSDPETHESRFVFAIPAQMVRKMTKLVSKNAS